MNLGEAISDSIDCLDNLYVGMLLGAVVGGGIGTLISVSVTRSSTSVVYHF